jgi:hypothetical protein
MLDKILKILWLVNGVLFFALLSFVGYRLYLEEFDSSYDDEAETALVIEGDSAEVLKKAKEVQGLVYNRIENVPGTFIRVLPISARRFNAPTGERKKDARRYLRNSAEVHHIGHDNVNYIFLDIDYKVISTLLTRKAFIHAAACPPTVTQENTLDPTIKNILYLISFEDSNNDGLLGESDRSDLYISDVDGSNLVQVTRDVFVQDFKFINNNSEVLISFQEPQAARHEDQPTRYAKYQIARETLTEMSDLHQELAKVETLLRADSTDKQP